MLTELLDSIKLLHEKIEECETAYQAALETNAGYDVLKNIRSQILFCKEELNRLELSLWDQFQKEWR